MSKIIQNCNHQTSVERSIYRKTSMGILYNFCGKNIGIVINFLFIIIIARHLGPADYGSYSFYRNTAYLLVLFTILGLDYAMNRFVPEITQTGDGSLLQQLLKKSFRIALLNLALISVIIILLFYLLPTYAGLGFSSSLFILVLFLGLIYAISFSGILKGVISGLFHQRILNITETLSIIVKLLLTLVFFHLGLDVEGVLLGVLIAFSFPSIFYYSHSKKEFNRLEGNRSEGNRSEGNRLEGNRSEGNRSEGNRSEGFASQGLEHSPRTLDAKWREVRRYSFIMFLFGITYFILGNQLDVIMLTFISGNSEAGFYNLSYRFAFINAMVFIGGIDGVLVPAFTSLKKEGAEKQRFLLNSAMKYTLFFLVPSAIGGVLFSEKIISVFFGSDYSSSVDLLRVFYLTLLLSMAFSWPLRFLLVSTGKERTVLRIYLGYGLINLGGNLILIPLYGGMGAVLATGAAAWGISLNLLHKVGKTGLLDFPCGFTVKTVVSSFLGILPFYFLLPYLDTLPQLALTYLLFCLVYCLLFLAMKGITREELMNLRNFILSSRWSGNIHK